MKIDRKDKISYFIWLTMILISLTACSESQSNSGEMVNNTITQETESKKEEVTESTTSEVTTEKITTEMTTEEVQENDFNPVDYRNDINYESLCRKPDEYKGMKIYMSGTVNSMLEEDNETILQIDVGDGLIMVMVDSKILEVRVLEEDKVTFYGEYQGLTKYETVAGKTKNDPYFIANHINIDSYDDTMESPTGELRSGIYSVTKNEDEFIYKKTAKFTYQDGEAFGCEVRVVREIVDRGNATILGDIFCFLKDEGNGVYTGNISGKGNIKITAYENSIKIETSPDVGMESYFEKIDDEYSFGDSTGGSAVNTNSDYILPGSDKGNLTEADISGMDKDMLALARNEIYARHGYIFQDPTFSDYFNSKSWYTPQYTADQFDSSVFNQYERQNILFIQSYEEK